MEGCGILGALILGMKGCVRMHTGTYHIAQDGSGDFTSVSEALLALKEVEPGPVSYTHLDHDRLSSIGDPGCLQHIPYHIFLFHPALIRSRSAYIIKISVQLKMRQDLLCSLLRLFVATSKPEQTAQELSLIHICAAKYQRPAIMSRLGWSEFFHPAGAFFHVRGWTGAFVFGEEHHMARLGLIPVMPAFLADML